MKSANYYNTFIEVSDDCPEIFAEIPPQKGNIKTVANMQFGLIFENPYKYTSDEVLFQVFVEKNQITGSDVITERENFFSKGQPCFRASPLPKRYGWGIHNNKEGKVALYAIESEEYKSFLKDKNLDHVKAVRSKRVKQF